MSKRFIEITTTTSGAYAVFNTLDHALNYVYRWHLAGIEAAGLEKVTTFEEYCEVAAHDAYTQDFDTIELGAGSRSDRTPADAAAIRAYLDAAPRQEGVRRALNALLEEIEAENEQIEAEVEAVVEEIEAEIEAMIREHLDA